MMKFQISEAKRRPYKLGMEEENKTTTATIMK